MGRECEKVSFSAVVLFLLVAAAFLTFSLGGWAG